MYIDKSSPIVRHFWQRWIPRLIALVGILSAVLALFVFGAYYIVDGEYILSKLLRRIRHSFEISCHPNGNQPSLL